MTLWLTHSLIYSFIHSLSLHSLTHLLACSLIHSFKKLSISTWQLMVKLYIYLNNDDTSKILRLQILYSKCNNWLKACCFWFCLILSWLICYRGGYQDLYWICSFIFLCFFIHNSFTCSFIRLFIFCFCQIRMFDYK